VKISSRSKLNAAMTIFKKPGQQKSFDTLLPFPLLLLLLMMLLA